MTRQVAVTSLSGTVSNNTTLIEDPTECPVCHHSIPAHFVPPALVSQTEVPSLKGIQWTGLQAIFTCPREPCHRHFIKLYVRADNAGSPQAAGYWDLKSTFPNYHQPRTFEPEISSISDKFAIIYNQSAEAEAAGLDEICGPGYRKALEFFIKDYAKQQWPDQTEKIEKMQLAPCIKEFIADPKVKQCAERATWLGNDETHYLRKWSDKDVRDLKQLIDLTMYWVLADVKTQAFLTAMPAAHNP